MALRGAGGGGAEVEVEGVGRLLAHAQVGDEQAARSVVGAGHVGRVQEPIGDLHQGDLRITRQHATGLSDFFGTFRNLRTRRGPQHHGAGQDGFEAFVADVEREGGAEGVHGAEQRKFQVDGE